MTVTNAVTQPALTRTALVIDVVAKAELVLLLVVAIAYPDLGNIRGKTAGSRAVRLSTRRFRGAGRVVVVVAQATGSVARQRARDTPWFTDTLGNRLNLLTPSTSSTTGCTS